MAKIDRFEDLEIWILSRELSRKIFNFTKKSVFKKDYPLIDQINRSSGSVMDNIAEGFERGGNKEFKNFLAYSKASCGETRSQIHRSFDKENLTKIEYEELVYDCERLRKKMLTS